MIGEQTITGPQREYVEGIAKRLRLPLRTLDDHCVRRFGRPLADLTKREASALLDEMIDWKALPAELQRAMGQLDLFSVSEEGG